MIKANQSNQNAQNQMFVYLKKKSQELHCKI